MDAMLGTSHRQDQRRLRTEARVVQSVPWESILVDSARVATRALQGLFRLLVRARLVLDVPKVSTVLRLAAPNAIPVEPQNITTLQ